MAQCPLCHDLLKTVRVPRGEGVYYRCPGCGGRAVTVPQVRRMAGESFATGMLRRINAAHGLGVRVCPFCLRPMKQFRLAEPPICLDGCRTCGAVWFDPSEFDTLPQPRLQSARRSERNPARELAAIHEARSRSEAIQEQPEVPAQDWKWIPGILGAPVELDSSTNLRRPWVTWAVSSLILLVSSLGFGDLRHAVYEFGLVAADPFRGGGLTWITSFLLHSGPIHLLGNLYFLMVAGDDVEDLLGARRFGVLLAASALAGAVLHVVATPRPAIPCIGASAGISGVLAFYAMAFPLARIGLLSRAFPKPGSWISIPAWLLFSYWVLLQLAGLLKQLSGYSRVSALAHLGGALVGVAFWLWHRQATKRRISNPAGKA